MTVYITDEGNPMDEADFIPYLVWLIEQYKAADKDWMEILASDFWGDQLLRPQILISIKELTK